MTIDRQKQLLREICSEYDLETLLDALCEMHGLADIADYIDARQQDFHLKTPAKS